MYFFSLEEGDVTIKMATSYLIFLINVIILFIFLKLLEIKNYFVFFN